MLNLKAANHEIILTSELYKSQESAAEGISSVKKSAVLNKRFEELDGADGKPYFVLHAANQLVIVEARCMLPMKRGVRGSHPS